MIRREERKAIKAIWTAFAIIILFMIFYDTIGKIVDWWALREYRKRKRLEATTVERQGQTETVYGPVEDPSKRK